MEEEGYHSAIDILLYSKLLLYAHLLWEGRQFCFTEECGTGEF